MDTVETYLHKMRHESSNSRDYAILVWCLADVHGTADQRDVELTDDEAREVLALVDHNHDCDLGVNWTTIDCFIDIVLEKRGTPDEIARTEGSPNTRNLS